MIYVAQIKQEGYLLCMTQVLITVITCLFLERYWLCVTLPCQFLCMVGIYKEKIKYMVFEIIYNIMSIFSVTIGIWIILTKRHILASVVESQSNLTLNQAYFGLAACWTFLMIVEIAVILNTRTIIQLIILIREKRKMQQNQVI